MGMANLVGDRAEQTSPSSGRRFPCLKGRRGEYRSVSTGDPLRLVRCCARSARKMRTLFSEHFHGRGGGGEHQKESVNSTVGPEVKTTIQCISAPRKEGDVPSLVPTCPPITSIMAAFLFSHHCRTFSGVLDSLSSPSRSPCWPVLSPQSHVCVLSRCRTTSFPPTKFEGSATTRVPKTSLSLGVSRCDLKCWIIPRRARGEGSTRLQLGHVPTVPLQRTNMNVAVEFRLWCESLLRASSSETLYN